MRKLLVICGTLLAAFAVSGAAVADEKAVGSAKTEVVVVAGDQHASFSAHSDPDRAGPCPAKGHIIQSVSGPLANGSISVKVIDLVVVGQAAFFGGPITKSDFGDGFVVGRAAYFTATDSGMPGGTGDTFRFLFTTNQASGGICAAPTPGFPLTSGNIVIKPGLP